MKPLEPIHVGGREQIIIYSIEQECFMQPLYVGGAHPLPVFPSHPLYSSLVCPIHHRHKYPTKLNKRKNMSPLCWHL